MLQPPYTLLSYPCTRATLLPLYTCLGRSTCALTAVYKPLPLLTRLSLDYTPFPGYAPFSRYALTPLKSPSVLTPVPLLTAVHSLMAVLLHIVIPTFASPPDASLSRRTLLPPPVCCSNSLMFPLQGFYARLRVSTSPHLTFAPTAHPLTRHRL